MRMCQLVSRSVLALQLANEIQCIRLRESAARQRVTLGAYNQDLYAKVSLLGGRSPGRLEVDGLAVPPDLLLFGKFLN